MPLLFTIYESNYLCAILGTPVLCRRHDSDISPNIDGAIIRYTHLTAVF